MKTTVQTMMQAAAFAVPGILGLGAGAAQADFYDGEVVTVVVPFGPGGGTDAWARILSEYLGRELGNDVVVQVVNKPGGGSMTGANEYALRTKHDGKTLFVTSGSTVTPWVLGSDLVKYDFNKLKIVAFQATGGVVYTTQGKGNSLDLLRSTTDEMIFADISATGSGAITAIGFEVLDATVKMLFGYGGAGETMNSALSGETNMALTSTVNFGSRFQPYVDRGDADILMTMGTLNDAGELVRDPVLPDVPTVKDAYVHLNGSEPSGLEWDAFKAVHAAGYAMGKIMWIHEDAPEEARNELQAAFERLLQNEEFQATVLEKLGPYEIFTGEPATRAFNDNLKVTDEMRNWMRNLLTEKYEVSQF